uniref:Uncharacterized protein n=1 Tax=Romanomermis culicivorax TaxID=13658 RepID=A0A915JDB7_ROMCU
MSSCNNANNVGKSGQIFFTIFANAFLCLLERHLASAVANLPKIKKNKLSDFKRTVVMRILTVMQYESCYGTQNPTKSPPYTFARAANQTANIKDVKIHLCDPEYALNTN